MTTKFLQIDVFERSFPSALVRSKKYSQSDVQQQKHFAMQFTGVFAPKASSVTKRTPYTKSLPQCFAVFAEFRLAGISARSPVNLSVLALAVCASRCLLTVYSSDQSCGACVPTRLAPRLKPRCHSQSPTQVQMVQALPHCSSGCSTRWRRDSSDAHVAAVRRSVLLLPLFACSQSRVGQSSKKKSIFSQYF